MASVGEGDGISTGTAWKAAPEAQEASRTPAEAKPEALEGPNSGLEERDERAGEKDKALGMADKAAEVVDDDGTPFIPVVSHRRKGAQRGVARWLDF